MPKPSLSVLGAFSLAALCLSHPPTLRAGESPATYTLRSARAAGSMDHVDVAIDLTGNQKVVEPSVEPGVEGKIPATPKLQRRKTVLQGSMVYDEKTIECGQGAAALRSLRSYDKAVATIQVEKNIIKPAIRDDRLIVGVSIELPKVALFSPAGPLTREELDLIDIFGNSLLLDQLLPGKPVTIGESWKHSNDLICALLGLDAVGQSSVESKLISVTNGTARFELNGNVEGAIGGVATTIEVKGKYRFAMSTGRIDWFGLLVKEDRSVGHVGPGLEATARVQMTIASQARCPRLDAAALQDLKPTPELTQLSYESPGGVWRILHDRGWFILDERQNTAVFRLIDRGEVVAQCNVALMDQNSPGRTTSLEDFQAEVQRALGKNFKRFAEAGQRTSGQGYRICRVVAEGIVEDLPIRWLYYLVADKSGPPVILVFTIEANLVEQFKQADETLVESVRLTEAKPAPAKPVQNDR